MNVRITVVALGTVVFVLVVASVLVDRRQHRSETLVDSFLSLALQGETEQAEECYDLLKEEGPRAVSPASKLLQHEDKKVRTLGAELLQELIEEIRERNGDGRMPREVLDTVPVLLASLNDETARVRGKAASALGWIGTEAAVALPALEQLLDDEDQGVRGRAERAVLRVRTGANE